MFNFKQLPPPTAYVNNLCTTKGYRRFFKRFYMNCHGDLSPCNNDSELGRSLTEMLGTLAVMGVLTIGGIAGFNYAMDKSKANDILDGINKRAIALSTYTLLGTNITASSLSAEFPNKIGDSTVAVAAEGDGFNLTVSGVSDSVCDKVLDTGLKMASKISLGETMVWNGSAKSNHACAEENTITFAFNAALDNTMTCGYCQHAENNTCVADETCDNGCPGDKPMKHGTCTPCDTTYILSDADATECAKCSNRFMTTDGKCLACDIREAYVADATECAKCPNREMLDNGRCALKECPNGYFKADSTGHCWHCSYGDAISADATECAKCSNREMLDGKCAPICSERQFKTSYGSCHDCDSSMAMPADATECAKCSNREMLDGKCTPICPEGQFRDSYGSCKSCSALNAATADAEECAKCSQRVMLDRGYCALKECTNRYFRNSGGSCIYCGNRYSYVADATECAKCSERKMQDGKCVLK